MSKKDSPKATPESAAPSESEHLDAVFASETANQGDSASAPAEPITDMDSVADNLAADLDGLRAELQEAQNRALRSSAELENYRKRANRQMDEERRYANLDLLRDLLPIWDNMGRAVDAAEQAGEADALLQGFKMVYSQLENVFERYHCVKIDAAGQAFDPNLHEAISQMPSTDHPSGTVLHVTQIGFQLHDRVVRPCQVVVSTAPPNAEDSTPGADDGNDEETG